MYDLPKSVCCACDPNDERLRAPSICFVCVFCMSDVILLFRRVTA